MITARTMLHALDQAEGAERCLRCRRRIEARGIESALAGDVDAAWMLIGQVDVEADRPRFRGGVLCLGCALEHRAWLAGGRDRPERSGLASGALELLYQLARSVARLVSAADCTCRDGSCPRCVADTALNRASLLETCDQLVRPRASRR